MSYKLNHQDIKDWLKVYDGELFDGVLCDPPYELGFMGKSWDSSGIAYDVEMWRGIFDLLKPGAHLLAFSGSRTYHRMAVAIEDAGFEIRDQIIWMYGSGFPKSLNIGKAVDKIQGNEREVTGKSRNGSNSLMGGISNTTTATEQDITKGTSQWEGYGTALKPAHEPCVLARKPIEGTVSQNVLKHGTGGLNIDGTRIQTVDNLNGGAYSSGEYDTTGKTYELGLKRQEGNYTQPTGRFPANLIHDGSDEVEAVFPQNKGANGTKAGNYTASNPINLGGGYVTETQRDKGSASRFFYCAKSSKSERNAGLEGFEEQITNDGREKDIDNAFQRGTTLRSNHHPTVKPLALTKYLATLIKPPSGGRLLVPFSGSGSEIIGALQAGWEYVEGVELTEEYIPIAEARIKYWLEKERTKQEVLL